MTPIATICAGLSAAGKRALLDAEPKGRGEDELFVGKVQGMGTMLAMHELGLVAIVTRGAMLTDRGMSARAHLLESKS